MQAALFQKNLYISSPGFSCFLRLHVQAILYLIPSETGSQCRFSRRTVEWWGLGGVTGTISHAAALLRLGPRSMTEDARNKRTQGWKCTIFSEIGLPAADDDDEVMLNVLGRRLTY